MFRSHQSRACKRHKTHHNKDTDSDQSFVPSNSDSDSTSDTEGLFYQDSSTSSAAQRPSLQSLGLDWSVNSSTESIQHPPVEEIITDTPFNLQTASAPELRTQCLKLTAQVAAFEILVEDRSEIIQTLQESILIRLQSIERQLGALNHTVAEVENSYLELS